MQRFWMCGLASVLFAIAAAGPATADVLNFSSLSQPGNSFVNEGASVTQDGFTISSSSGALEVWGASSPNLPSLNTADTSLFEFFAGSVTAASNGGTFNLLSIDLAPVLAGGAGSFTVSFEGKRADSSTVSQMFTVNDGTPPALQTFAFSNFTDLVSVSFAQGTNIGFFATQDTAYQFDNLVVETASSVPEPAAIVLLGTVLAVLAGRYRARYARHTRRE
jgi:hypothetical protein